MSFKYIPVSKGVKKFKNYYIANEATINNLNKHSVLIKEMTNYFSNNLTQGRVDYVYKSENMIKMMPVEYKKENYPHLTGIHMINSSAKDNFEMLRTAENTKPLFIEDENLVRKKLEVLKQLPDLLTTNSKVLDDLNQVKQAKRIGTNRGIRNNAFLLALKDFNPEFYQPKSLLNVKNNKQYDKIPNNTILGIFREKPEGTTVKMEPIALNKNSLSYLAITTKMLVTISKYGMQRSQELRKERQLVNEGGDKKNQVKLKVKKISAKQHAEKLRQQWLDR